MNKLPFLSTLLIGLCIFQLSYSQDSSACMQDLSIFAEYVKVKNYSNNTKINEIINSDIQLAKKLKISGTPAFIIQNDVITGWMGKKIFESLINN